jgi:DNA polymerase-3 subunit delta
MAAPLSFDSAYRALKGKKPAPVYYLTGDEEMLKEEFVELVLNQAVEPSSRDFNVDVRNAPDVTGEGFHSLVETPPMLAERRAVVIKNVGQWRRNSKVRQVVDRYVENPSPTTVLVLVSEAGRQGQKKQEPDKLLARAATHVVLKPLGPKRLRRWITVRAERDGFNMTDAATEHLLHAVGPGLSQLAMEIGKLAVIAPQDTPVDFDEVAQLVGVRRGETLHDWVDAVLLREIPKAVDMLDPVLAAAGINAVKLITALGTGLVGVRLARAFADEGVAPEDLGKRLVNVCKETRPPAVRNWSDEANSWARAASKWSGPEINEALRLTHRCDLSLKSTTLSDDRGTVQDLLLSLSLLGEVAV